MSKTKNALRLALVMVAAAPLYADDEELCPTGKTFLFGCDPIDPVYQLRLKLIPLPGRPIDVKLRQSPIPPGTPPTASAKSCAVQKAVEGQYASSTETVAHTALAALGTELVVTNLAVNPISVTLTGEAPGEPLKSGETRKISLTTAEQEDSTSVSIPQWRVWEKATPGKKKVCERDKTTRRFKAQGVTLTVKGMEDGAWESTPSSQTEN